RRCVSNQPMRGESRGYNRLWNKAMRFKQRASPVCIAASGQTVAIVNAARHFKNGLNEPDR
ncbi:hypothetical protein PQR02_33715, partial [Paraburkholderia sediminicola]|uniref:hypothetical protein n=1 Tax=Paraburkholderia sediminicola TaxID=458836 RepID=UPI0038BD405D